MIRILFTFIIFNTSAAWAITQTETHTYIENKETLHIINRLTSSETVLDIGFKPQPMIIHKDKGYLMGFHGEIAVLDLKRNLIIQKSESLTWSTSCFKLHTYNNIGFVHTPATFIPNGSIVCIDLVSLKRTASHPTGACYDDMVVRNDKGYLISPDEKTQSLSIFDFKTQKIKVVDLPFRPMSKPIFSNNTGYINLDTKNDNENSIQTFDSETGTLGFAFQPGVKLSIYPMVIIGQQGYVPDVWKYKLSIIDLKTHQLLKTVDTPESPEKMRVYRDVFYFLSGDKKNIFRFDPLTEAETYALVDAQLDICFTDNRAVILNEKNEIVILSLDTFKPVHRYANPYEIKFWDSKLHEINGEVYVNTHKIYPTVAILDLFDPVFTGIEADLWSDGEEAFTKFEKHIKGKEFDRAVKPFQIALSAAHPKAFAWAAYAFSHGCWGAEIDFEIAGQFWVCMDRTYYNDLTRIEFQ